jgi:HlyD family secretion protein
MSRAFAHHVNRVSRAFATRISRFSRPALVWLVAVAVAGTRAFVDRISGRSRAFATQIGRLTRPALVWLVAVAVAGTRAFVDRISGRSRAFATQTSRLTRPALVWLVAVAVAGTRAFADRMTRLARAFATQTSRLSRPALVGLITVAFVGSAITISRLGGGAVAEAAPSLATASRGDLVVTVGGVGRIVEARASGQVITAAGGTAGSASGSTPGASAGAGATTVSVDAVFPRTAGFVSNFLVVPGQRVAAGQALAYLDDSGRSADAVRQAQNELSMAVLELRQVRTNDPARGVPATRRELAAARLAVVAARQHLARLRNPAHSADVSAARYDVKRAQADLEALRGGTTAAVAEAVRIARRDVEAARERLNQLLEPADPADVAAAEWELRKAEADLALLRKPPQSPTPEAIVAAHQAVTVARQNLAAAQAVVPADPAAVAAAQLELDKALAELAALQRPPASPLREELTAAEKAVDAARLKLAKLQRPASRAAVAAARLDLERAQAELRKLQAGPSPAAFAAARQAVSAASARLAQLLGPPLRADITAARLEVRRAQADLAVLRARGRPSRIGVSFARLKVEAARARLAAARYNRRLLTVRAPAEGTVAALMTVPGVPVDQSTPVAAVAALDRLAVTVDLSEFDVARVRRGMRAVVRVDALGGRAFPGKVLFAALTGNDSAGLVTFPVRVSLTRSTGVRPGMNVSVRIIVAERHDVVQVPLEAVTQDEEDRNVVRVKNASGRISVRRVKLGLANNERVQIAKGVRAGEHVLVEESPESVGGEEE